MYFPKGIFFGVGDGGSPEAFSQVLNVTQFTPAAVTWTTQDVSDHNSTDRIKLLVPVIRTGGSFDVTMNAIDSDAVQATLKTLSISGAQNNFQIVYPGGLIGSFTFAGYVNKYSEDTPTEGIQTIKCTIDVYGTIGDDVPTVASMALTDAHHPTYVTGDVLTLQATFDEDVIVTGNPRVAVTIGANTRNASYSGGSGTNKLTFAYTIISGDSAAATHVSVASPIALNSGTIKDTQKQAATLTFTPPTTSTVTVN